MPKKTNKLLNEFWCGIKLKDPGKAEQPDSVQESGHEDDVEGLHFVYDLIGKRSYQDANSNRHAIDNSYQEKCRSTRVALEMQKQLTCANY